MRTCLLLTIFITSHHIFATPLELEQEYVRKLNQSTSARDVEVLQSTFEQIRMLRLACRLQIQSRFVPTNCFEVLRLERRWGLRTRGETSRAEQDLNERCRKAAQGLRLPPLASSTTELSKICLRQVQEAREIQAYRARESDTWSEN
jgi:hypothetical protein